MAPPGGWLSSMLSSRVAGPEGANVPPDTPSLDMKNDVGGWVGFLCGACDAGHNMNVVQSILHLSTGISETC